jgi:hypothetical protein
VFVPCSQVVTMVVASAVNIEGEEIHPRKWNNEFKDMPIVEEDKQNTSTLSSEDELGFVEQETGTDDFHSVCESSGRSRNKRAQSG